eukprot:Awhi_evm1s3277
MSLVHIKMEFGMESQKLRTKDGDNTHNWQVFVRPPTLDHPPTSKEQKNIENFKYISHVVFELHDSYTNPKR